MDQLAFLQFCSLTYELWVITVFTLFWKWNHVTCEKQWGWGLAYSNCSIHFHYYGLLEVQLSQNTPKGILWNKLIYMESYWKGCVCGTVANLRDGEGSWPASEWAKPMFSPFISLTRLHKMTAINERLCLKSPPQVSARSGKCLSCKHDNLNPTPTQSPEPTLKKPSVVANTCNPSNVNQVRVRGALWLTGTVSLPTLVTSGSLRDLSQQAWEETPELSSGPHTHRHVHAHSYMHTHVHAHIKTKETPTPLFTSVIL